MNLVNVKKFLTENPSAVIVLDFYDAPKELRGLSGHGGDEDYVIIEEYKDDMKTSLYSKIVDRLTICDSQTFENSGLTVTIIAHS